MAVLPVITLLASVAYMDRGSDLAEGWINTNLLNTKAVWHGPNTLMDVLTGPDFKTFQCGPNVSMDFWVGPNVC